jgi:hypothetical protein
MLPFRSDQKWRIDASALLLSGGCAQIDYELPLRIENYANCTHSLQLLAKDVKSVLQIFIRV